MVQQHQLDVTFPGMVDRSKINEFYNRSKLFVHMGGGGQNDRGPLEALSCGTAVLVSNQHRHHRIVYQNPTMGLICHAPDDAKSIAVDIHGMLSLWEESDKSRVNRYFEKSNGVETVILPAFERLFSLIRKNPIPNVEALIKEYL
jgi:glycosyltransferase involved in cell wall biosynthesis